MEQTPPDIVLLGPEWPERALLRAQFIEEGYDVIAIDPWPIPTLYRRPSMKPRVLLIDLQGLPDLEGRWTKCDSLFQSIVSSS
jgi:hypothetical protein